MRTVFILAMIFTFLLTGCSSNSKVQETSHNENQNVVEKEELACSNENVTESTLKDYILCLADNQLYSDIESTVATFNKQDDEVLSVISTYAKCMIGSALTDECTQVTDKINSLYDKELLDFTRYFSYVNRISDRTIAQAEAAASKAQQDYNEKYFAPKIGMSAQKVLESTWGEPTDINKTTTKYGVHEQWVYYGGRYVYLEDGIVTSIQE